MFVKNIYEPGCTIKIISVASHSSTPCSLLSHIESLKVLKTPFYYNLFLFAMAASFKQLYKISFSCATNQHLKCATQRLTPWKATAGNKKLLYKCCSENLHSDPVSDELTKCTDN
jgi:hypothetical protein